MSTISPPCPVSLNDAARGLTQQMVFWGHDVRHANGNALVRFGLTRIASPGLTGTSCYRMPWEGGLIELHGAVASWTPPAGGRGSVFCRDRSRIELWSRAFPPVPGREYGETGSAEQRWLACQPFLRWLAAYENWVVESLGTAWRHGCWRALKRLPGSRPWLPPALALKWWELAVTGQPPRPRALLKSTMDPNTLIRRDLQ